MTLRSFSKVIGIVAVSAAFLCGNASDYAWIENAKNGEVVWEMTYRTTTHAGGSKKNRVFDKTVYLEKGEYEVHYQTDDSHAFNDWNDDAPDDRTHWGVTIYKEQ